MLIGITGKAGSGKDEVARYLNQAHDFRQLTFAEPIKYALGLMFDVCIDTLEKTLGKDAPIPGIGKSLRELYQTLGTDWGRDMIDVNLWVRHLAHRLQAYPAANVVVSDVRFENEADFIRANGGTIIHIDRDAAPKTREHVSEAGITFKQGQDIWISNNGTPETLYDKAAQTLEAIRDEHTKSQAA